MNSKIVTPTVEQRKLLDLHLQLVIEENKITNLTRIIDWDSAQILHIEDSLVGLPEIQGAPSGRYLDMGTGAGFPGIPIAIMTGRETVLADSVGKKTKALDRIINALNIASYVSTYNGRIEELSVISPESFSVISARALSSLASLLELSSPLLKKNGYLVCYKSQDVDEELEHAKSIADKLGFEYVSKRDALLSDGITERSIIVFEKIHEPLVALPRRVGMAQKKPY
ncbi:MAG: 16S rRNA (guanine(527)-N(7))-methyltransferase RsmG [Eggerthellaceae bacterium]|nr:16S rRNA (guanine(527)-N(7))-methyltransferase RsmG [Eggerthellaceae bacterium]